MMLGEDQDVEPVLVHVRTHPKVLVPRGFVLLVLLGFVVLAVKFLPSADGPPGSYVSMFVYGALLVGFGWFVFLPFLQWRAGTYTVTSRRIGSDAGVLYKKSFEIPLERITQVSVERGILDRIFRCGTMQIYDAANANGIRFNDVPRVDLVKATIDEARLKNAEAIRAANRGDLPVGSAQTFPPAEVSPVVEEVSPVVDGSPFGLPTVAPRSPQSEVGGIPPLPPLP